MVDHQKTTPKRTPRRSKTTPTHNNITDSPIKRFALSPRVVHVGKKSAYIPSPAAKKAIFNAAASPVSHKDLQRHTKATKTTIKTSTYDRFIPNRTESSVESAIYKPTPSKNTVEYLDDSQIAYQSELAKACCLDLSKRILSFNVPAPTPSASTLINSQNWNRPLRPTKRNIPTAPSRILDAPGLRDDYYLNLLDWSSTNVVAIALDKSVYLWNASTGNVEELCTSHESDYIASVKWTKDGSYLAVGTGGGDTQIWDAETSAKVRSMSGHIARVGVVAWDRHILSTGSRDGSIHTHDVRIAAHKIASLASHTHEVCGLAYREDGGMLASGGNDNLLNIWDARNTLTPKFSKTAHSAAVKALAWCPWQMGLLASGGGSRDGNIHFWNTSTGSKLSSISTSSQVSSLIWSREYREILSTHGGTSTPGSPSNHLSLWSYPSNAKIADLQGHDMRVLYSAASPDGQSVVTGSGDENLKFWKAFEHKRGGKLERAAAASAGREIKSEDDDGIGELSSSMKKVVIR